MSRLLPLESNPEVLTKYMHTCGVSPEWQISDVYGLEAETLGWLPQPVKAMILLFPCSETYEKHRADEHKILSAKQVEHPKSLFYMRQFTHNACGTVAILHSVANCEDIKISDGVFKNFLDKAKDLNPEERGQALENDESLVQSHQALAQEGQTAADPEQNVNHHFIALINKEGILYELDGRKSFPVQHGPTSDETFVTDAARVCQDFMDRDPEEVRFTVLALTAAAEK